MTVAQTDTASPGDMLGFCRLLGEQQGRATGQSELRISVLVKGEETGDGERMQQLGMGFGLVFFKVPCINCNCQGHQQLSETWPHSEPPDC